MTESPDGLTPATIASKMTAPIDPRRSLLVAGPGERLHPGEHRYDDLAR